MATPAITQWDAQGNPISPTAHEWDANGKPIASSAQPVAEVRAIPHWTDPGGIAYHLRSLRNKAINELPVAGGLIGGLIGTGAGAETGPGAIATGVAGATAGGALGEDAKQAIFRALYPKNKDMSAGQAAEKIAAQGGIQGLTELGGQVGGRLVGRLVRPVARLVPEEVFAKYPFLKSMFAVGDEASPRAAQHLTAAASTKATAGPTLQAVTNTLGDLEQEMGKLPANERTVQGFLKAVKSRKDAMNAEAGAAMMTPVGGQMTEIGPSMPPVREGYVRLYRAESPTENFSTVFNVDKAQSLGLKKPPEGVKAFTSDPDYADYYRQSYGRNAKTFYIDVPKSVAEAADRGNGEFYIRQGPLAAQKTVPTGIADSIRNLVRPWMDQTAQGRAQKSAILRAAKDYDKPWSYAELDTLRTDLASQLAKHNVKGSVAKYAAEKGDTDLAIDNAVLDGLRNTVYPEMDRAAGKPAGYFENLKGRQSALISLQQTLEKRVKDLSGQQAISEVTPRLSGENFSLSAHAGSLPRAGIYGVRQMFSPTREMKAASKHVLKAFPDVNTLPYQVLFSAGSRIPQAIHTAKNAQGHTIGSNDGVNWFDTQTGAPVNAR